MSRVILMVYAETKERCAAVLADNVLKAANEYGLTELLGKIPPECPTYVMNEGVRFQVFLNVTTRDVHYIQSEPVAELGIPEGLVPAWGAFARVGP